MDKEVIILTKSSKYKQYCVAGLDYKTGKWVRLVSDDITTHGALSINQIHYKDGTYCNPRDLVRVKIKGTRPAENQPENILIDDSYHWEKIGVCSIEEIIGLHPPEKHDFIFGNTHYYITENQICSIGYSLTFVRVNDLVINHVISYGKPKTKASFHYNRQSYNYMAVTDPEYYQVRDQTRYNEAILVLSLPESPFPDDKYFKFVAQIFPLKKTKEASIQKNNNNDDYETITV